MIPTINVKSWLDRGGEIHAEYARTKSLERRFSTGSSGDAERRCCTEVEIAVTLDGMVAMMLS